MKCATLLFCLSTLCVAATATEALTPEEWREDLAQLEDHIRANHRNPFHSLSEPEFSNRVRLLDEDIPGLSGTEVVLRFTELLAGIGDGHSRLALPVRVENLGFLLGHAKDMPPNAGVPRFRTLPIRLARYEEGLFVTAATEEQADLLGLQVTRIGTASPEEALQALHPLVAADNSEGRSLVASRWLAVHEVLEYAGLAKNGRVRLLLAGPQGSREVHLEPVAFESEPTWVEIQLPPVGSLPENAAFYSFRYLEERESLVVDLRRLNDSADEPIGVFANRLSSAIAQRRPERIVLDLRSCQGGDQALSRALVLPLIRWPGSSEVGRLFVLTGPYTFSAAVNLASRLEEWTQAVFVGEKLGSGPAHYSSSDKEVLSNSGLIARVSSGYFMGWTGSESRDSVSLSMPVVPRFADAWNGVDTVLEVALQGSPQRNRLGQLVAAFEAGDINSALIMWMRYRTDPRTSALLDARLGNDFARYLLEKEHPRYAANIYLFNREIFPGSVEAYLGEARARVAMGDRNGAVASLEAGLTVAPKDADLRAAFGQLAAESRD